MLELVTLFTKEEDKETAALIFSNKKILRFTFQMLLSKNRETLKLAALALSRLAANLNEENSAIFIENLKEFRDFDGVV